MACQVSWETLGCAMTARSLLTWYLAEGVRTEYDHTEQEMTCLFGCLLRATLLHLPRLNFILFKALGNCASTIVFPTMPVTT